MPISKDSQSEMVIEMAGMGFRVIAWLIMLIGMELLWRTSHRLRALS